MVDQILTIAFESAHTAIFEVGSVMAVLMLIFGLLDYKYGDRLRTFIEKRKLDKPVLMTALSLIPVDGTLLFQYSLYRRRSIRFGSLYGGILGIGEEATYLILSMNPITWLIIAATKLLLSLGLGSIINAIPALQRQAQHWQERDQKDQISDDIIEADENFHELPDKFRHKLHHFRYHDLGFFFWVFFGVAFLVELVLSILDRTNVFTDADQMILKIPAIHWLSMLMLLIVGMYRIVIWFTTREFGKLFDHEFESTSDAAGDLAETCASIILLIFLMTFIVQTAIALIGQPNLERFFAGRGLIAVIVGALIGLIPGTGASLAFTSLYFSLAGTAGALPFASLAACSIALIGDSQFIGARQIRHSQRAAHLLAFATALLAGLAIFFIF